MAYRSKPPEQVFEYYETLVRKYRFTNFLVVDNILDMSYFRNLLPRMEESANDYSLVYQLKSNLKRPQVHQLYRAGLRFVQPGIESLHDEILTRLNKGASACINIELLKWTRETGIHTVWLMLTGMPDVDDHWYRETAELVPLITHLQPPYTMTDIMYTRFSVYHNNPEQYGLSFWPKDQYSYIYPLSRDKLMDMVYYFQIHPPDSPGQSLVNTEGPGLDLLRRRVGEWLELWRPYQRGETNEPATLEMEETDSGIIIRDTRPCVVEPLSHLTGPSAQVFKILETAAAPAKILSGFNALSGSQADWEELLPIIRELEERKLVVRIGKRYLGLAAHKSQAPVPWEFPGGMLDNEKLTRAFEENRFEPEAPNPFDTTLNQLFAT